MNSALQPQLLKLEEVFDETVKAGTTSQEELKSAILLRCVCGQLKSYLNLTIGDNVQYSALREHVMQWDRPRQKWATAMVASSPCQWMLIGSRMPEEKVRRVRKTARKAKVKMPRAKERKEKEIRHEKKVIKDQKGKRVATFYNCGKPGHLAKDCWRIIRRSIELSRRQTSGQKN